MKFRLTLVLILIAIAGLNTAAHAEATADAGKWLNRLYGILEEGPFSMDYTMEFNGEQNGQAMSVAGSGHLLQNGPGLSVNELNIEMSGMANQPAMTLNTRQVSDGTTLWVETEIAALGMTQVGKIGLDALSRVEAGQSGLSLGQSQMLMDPISQIESLVTAFDVALTGIEDGKVSLSMEPTAETLASMKGDMGEDATLSGVLVLDEKTASPLSMDLDLGPAMTAKLGFSGFTPVDASGIEEGTFSYTPPEGAAVMDLAPMLGGGGQ